MPCPPSCPPTLPFYPENRSIFIPPTSKYKSILTTNHKTADNDDYENTNCSLFPFPGFTEKNGDKDNTKQELAEEPTVYKVNNEIIPSSLHSHQINHSETSFTVSPIPSCDYSIPTPPPPPPPPSTTTISTMPVTNIVRSRMSWSSDLRLIEIVMSKPSYVFHTLPYLLTNRVQAQSTVQDRSMVGLITDLKYDHYPAIWLRDSIPTIAKFFDILLYHYDYHRSHSFPSFYFIRYLVHSRSHRSD